MVSHGAGLVFRAFYSLQLQMWACPQLKLSIWREEHNQISSGGGHDPSEMGMGKYLSDTGRMTKDMDGLRTAKLRAGQVLHCSK